MSDEQGSGSSEDFFERLQRDLLHNRTLEEHKHPRPSLNNCFPEREDNKPRIRKSAIDLMVARILKNEDVSSTPMPAMISSNNTWQRSTAATSKQSIGTLALNLAENTHQSSIVVQTSKKSLDAAGPSGIKIARNLFSNTRGLETQTTDSLQMNRWGGTPELSSSDDWNISIIDDDLASVDETVKSLPFSERLPGRCPSAIAVGFMNAFSTDEDDTFCPQPPKKEKVLKSEKKESDNVEISPPPPVEDNNGLEADGEQSEHKPPRKNYVQAESARKNIDDIFENRQQHSLTNQPIKLTLTDENVNDQQESDGELLKSRKKRSNRVVSSDNAAKEVNDRPAKGKQVKKANNTKVVKKRKTAANSSNRNPNPTVVSQTTMPSILINSPSEGLRRSTRKRKPVPPKAMGVVFVKTERALKIYNGTAFTSSFTQNRSSVVSAKNPTKNLASVEVTNDVTKKCKFENPPRSDEAKAQAK